MAFAISRSELDPFSLIIAALGRDFSTAFEFIGSLPVKFSGNLYCKG